MMEVLKKDFKDRGSIIEYVKTLAPWGEGDASQTRGGRRGGEGGVGGRTLRHLVRCVHRVRKQSPWTEATAGPLEGPQ